MELPPPYLYTADEDMEFGGHRIRAGDVYFLQPGGGDEPWALYRSGKHGDGMKGLIIHLVQQGKLRPVIPGSASDASMQAVAGAAQKLTPSAVATYERFRGRRVRRHLSIVE